MYGVTGEKDMDMVTYDNGYGRVFTLVRTEPFITKRGEMVTLNVWEAPCGHPGCVEKFHIKVTASDVEFRSKSFYIKHCAAHRLTPSEAFRNMRLARRKVRDVDVAEIRRLAAEGHTPDAIALVYPIAPRTVRAIVSGERR
jgi:hypothetical protein